MGEQRDRAGSVLEKIRAIGGDKREVKRVNGKLDQFIIDR